MSLTTAVPLVLQDPGFLFWAPLLTAEPAHVAAGSTYDADVWTAAWISMGATENGSKVSSEIQVEPVYAAEFADPLRWSTITRKGSLGFAMLNFTLNNLKRAYNGGTIATVSGTGATLSSSLVGPTPGQEVRAMLGWESLDHTVRFIAYQTLNGGAVEVSNVKQPALAVIPCMFNFEVPSGAPNTPIKWYAAGTARLGT